MSHALQVQDKIRDQPDRWLRVVSSAREFAQRRCAVPVDPCGGVDGAVLRQIDYFAMNLALPRMASDLNSNATDLQWVISVYMLTLGAFMVPVGRVGDIFGRRKALLAGIGLFGVASQRSPSPGRVISAMWPL